MKIFTVFLAILVAFTFLGCGEDEEGEEENGLAAEYEGFPQMNGGEWAEHTVHTESAEGRTKFEYIGTDTIDGTECYVLEIEVQAVGQNVISQVWVDKGTLETKLYVIKQAGMVIRMDVSELPASSTDVSEGASGETPDEYEPGAQTSIETYVTPTAKMVKAAVFKIGSDEEWVSSEVPFGIVKEVSDGEPVMELYDFSFSGAERDISKEEVENAVSLPDIPGIPNIPNFP